MKKEWPVLNKWIASSLLSVSKKLPRLVEEYPASFECGYTMGYKFALLDLERLLEDTPGISREIFISQWVSMREDSITEDGPL